jgi:2-phosphoglycerate kinase
MSDTDAMSDNDTMSDNDVEMVVVTRDPSLPYSKGLMAQALMATGLPPERAYEIASAVGERLHDSRQGTITLQGLEEIATAALGEADGKDTIVRFRKWQDLTRLAQPLVILVGGTTGVGKSTLATQIAHRLGITRVVSTDTVRQVMRAFFAPDLMPEIQYSSFEAGAGVRIPLPDWSDIDEAGFIEQARSIAVGVNAVVDRAITEGQRTIIEGVHIVPGFLDRSRWGDAVVVEVMVAISDAERHRSHFYVREWETDGIRPLRRYIQNFAKIRKVQDYLLTQAHRQGVTVLENTNIDQAVKALMADVLDAVSEYSGPAARRNTGG